MLIQHNDHPNVRISGQLTLNTSEHMIDNANRLPPERQRVSTSTLITRLTAQ